MTTVTFIYDMKREIERLERLIKAASGAEAQLGILRGAVEMLEDIEKQPPPHEPLVPRFGVSDDKEGAMEALLPREQGEGEPAEHAETPQDRRRGEGLPERISGEPSVRGLRGGRPDSSGVRPQGSGPEAIQYGGGKERQEAVGGSEGGGPEVRDPLRELSPSQDGSTGGERHDSMGIPSSEERGANDSGRAAPASVAARPYVPLEPRPSRTEGEPQTVEITLTDAATLEPVTQRQLDAYYALWKLRATDVTVTVKKLTEAIGFHSGDAIEALCKKGYAKRNSNSYPHSFYPIAVGQPRIAIVPFPQKAISGDAARGELNDDPAPGRSALDRKRAIGELNPVGYLRDKGHDCKSLGADMYQLDRNTVPLTTILDQINVYRAKEHLPALDLKRYL